MIDVNLLRANPEAFKKGVASKKVDSKVVDEFLDIDEKWRSLTAEVDSLRSEQRKISAGRQIEEAKKIKQEIKEKSETLSQLESERLKKWRQIPNIPLPEVIIGQSEADNKVLREVGEKKKFSFPARDYVSISEELNLIDTKRAAKVSGSRFGYLLGAVAKMEFALGNFLIDSLTNEKTIREIIKENNLKVLAKPFVPVIPPVMVNEKSIGAMGYLERGKEEIYSTQDNLYLVGTSEQSIGPMHQDEVFESSELPRRYLGFSTCFRREAGSYGKDTKGILRVHQFDKFEMFSFSLPEFSAEEHKFLLAVEEYIMKSLKIPYHVLDICSADLGDSAAAKYDIEAWLPGQKDGKGEYRETHSTSNTTDFQARRLNIKYRHQENGKQKTEFVHMLNGTASAIGRMIIAIIENYQTEKGTVLIPEVLQKYFSGEKEIK